MVYEEKDQKVCFVKEVTGNVLTYLTPYDPETDAGVAEVTKLPADYPHLERFDPLPDADIGLKPPIRIKKKVYDVGGGKHPSHIVNSHYEIAEFELSTEALNMALLSYAIGKTVTSVGTRAMVDTITCVADVSDSLDGTYILLDVISSEAVKHYCIWIDVDDSGTVSPAVTGIGNHTEVTTIATNDTAADVATAIAAVIQGLTEITTAVASAGVITITHTNSGAVRQARNGAASPGFSYEVSTWGASTYTLTENIGRELASFTTHVEQVEEDGVEDVIFDLFGCVINTCVIDIDFESETVKTNYTVQSPMVAVDGNALTNPPVKKKNESFTFGHINQTGGYVLQEGATDKTPTSIKKLTLTIENNIEFFPDVGYNYLRFAASKKRNISLNIVGFDSVKELFDYWKGLWNNTEGHYDSLDRLNSVIKLRRLADYDEVSLSIYNWLVEEHNFHIFNIDEGIAALDVTLTDATPDANLRIISAATMKSYEGQTSMPV